MDNSTDIFSTDYDTQKSNMSLLEKDLESKNQLIYDYKQRIVVATALENDYLQEIETLQSNGDAEIVQLQRTVKELEEDILSLRNSSNLELSQKIELINSLQNEIEEVSKNVSNDEERERKFDETNSDVEWNLKLKQEMLVLNDALIEVQTSIENAELQKANLQETNNELSIELDHTKENFKCKIQELAETKNLIKNLQEDSLLIERELESMKNKPLDGAKKGNSLFGEVEDSRIKTLQNIQQIKKKYAELKGDVCNKLKQMSAIRARNRELSHHLNFIKSSDEENEKIIEEYKNKVAALESAVEDCKQEVLKEQKFTGNNLPAYSVEFAHDALKAKWNDDLQLRDELNRESKKKLETFANIKNANTEMRDWRRKALQLKITIEKLENVILEIELQSSPTHASVLENLLVSPEQKVPASSVPKCFEVKPDMSNEKHLNRSTITLRKKSSVDHKPILEQNQ